MKRKSFRIRVMGEMRTNDGNGKNTREKFHFQRSKNLP